MKHKTCKVCRIRFEPSRPMQVVCSPLCATKYAWIEKSKAEIIAHREDRKTIRLKLEKLKTRSEWMRDAQKAFNSFVRARDDGKPCICCGKSLGGSGNGLGGHFDCGHYRSIGSAPHLRFDVTEKVLVLAIKVFLFRLNHCAPGIKSNTLNTSLLAV